MDDAAAVLRIEKSGRAGKTVTVIGRLPRAKGYLEDLARKLKTACGSGGTFFIDETGGVIEIQGDKRVLIRKILARENVPCKG